MADADVQGMLIRIEATTAQLRRELASADQLVGQTAGSIDRGLGKVDSAFDRTAQKAREAGNLMRGAFATIAGAGLIGGLIKQADSYGQIADRMRAATSSSAEYQLVQQHLLQTAQETYRPLQEAQELYIRTADVMKSLGYNAQQTMAITDSFSYLLVTNAASADKGATALDAYSKALQTGKIEADGWVSIVSAMPTVTAAVATATGKSAEEIRKLGVEGKLALSDLNKGFEQTVAANREAAARMSVSVTDALNNISNAISAYIGEANESSGATGELASVLDVVAKNIDVVAAAVAGLLAAGATGYFLKFSTAAWSSAKAMIAEATATREAAAAKVENSAAAAAMAASYATEMSATLENARATEANAAAKVRSLQVSRDQLAYTAALAKGTQEEARYTAALAATELELAAAKKAAFTASTQLGTALAAESAAMGKDAAATVAASTAKKEYAAVSSLAARAGSGLLALLGGPAGIVALAAGAGIAFLTMRDGTDQASISLDDMKAPLDQIIAKFKTLNEDQRKAALVRWSEAQAEAAKTAATEFGNLAASIRSATVDPGQARLGGYSVQLKEYTELIKRLKDAQANGQALTPILEGLRGKAGIDNAQIDSWIKQAGVVSDAGAVLKDVTLKLKEQSGALNANTAETNANNAAKAGMSEAGTTYLQALQKQLAGLQDGGDATKIANRYISEHSDLTDADKTAILSAASAIEANKEATKRAAAATKSGNSAAKEAATEAKNQAKALTDLKAQADIAINSATGLAAAYLAGTDKSREFTLQQKVEEALLKTGAGVRKDVEKAINDQQDAQDKLNISKAAYDLGKETEDLLAQAKATLQGADALAAYNVQKSMTVALAGKNIEAGSKEYAQLLAATKAQQDAVKAAQQASEVGSIMDRLYPEQKLLREYTEGQAALNKAMELAPEKAADYQAALVRLGLEYEQNKNAATAWGQFTEGAVDRVDSAFADAWKNIDDGFSGFAISLKDGFKQLLAELAHMAITKPIIMQIGASLGVGGLSAQSSGLFGGSSGGGSSLDTIFSAGKSIYSAASSGFGSAVSAGWSAGEGFLGGMQGAISNGSSYISSGLSGLFGSGGVSAASSMAAGASQAGYTGAAMSSWTAGQNAAASATSYGPALSAISGAIMGYQNSGFKGAAAGAAGGYAGAQGGAMLGTYIAGPIGTAVGAVIGGMLGAIGGSKLFGGDWQTKDQGFSLGVENGDFAGQQFEYQKKKGGLFSSNKKRTRLSALDPEMQKSLDNAYDATEGSVLSLFDRLNVQLNDGVLDGLNIAASQISTKDKTAEQIQAEITKWFGGVADFMTVAVANATGSGTAGYDFEALTEFVNNLYGVNDVIKHLNVGLFDMSVTGGFMAEQLSAWAGGFEALKTSAATYYDGFYTDAEKSANTLSDVRKEFENLGITLPETRQGYRDMVEALDLTTESGRAMFVTLTSLSGDAAQAFTILEASANSANQALADALNGAVTGAMGAVQRAVAVEQKEATKAYNDRTKYLNDMVSTATANVSGLTAVGNDLSAALKALRGDSDDAVKMLRAQAQATLQSALATARSGGSLSGITGLSDALDTVSSNNTDLYASMEDFARDQGRTANVVAELNALNGKQLSTEEQLLASAQDQIKLAKDQFDEEMAKFDRQLELAQAQIDALNGVDTSVLSVAAAMSGLAAAITGALAAKPAGSAAANTSANNSTLLNAVYQSVLGRDVDAAGAAYWGDLLKDGKQDYAGLVDAITKDAKANGELKKYATGGLITGPGTGTSDSIFARLSAGEYVLRADAVRTYGTGLLDQMNNLQLPAFARGGGPQLEVMAPSSIYSANQAGTMRSSEMNTVQLEQKVDVLIDVVKQIVGPMKINSDADSKLFKKWDRVGLQTIAVGA